MPPERLLGSAVSVGAERTFHQDLGFGMRQLADIALRALSPAVNDPTTAVRCLDRIVRILPAVAGRPLRALYHRDHRGAVRLARDLPGWDDLVDLGLTEVRGLAAGNPQVTPWLMAGLEDLLPLAPPERRRRWSGTVRCRRGPWSGRCPKAADRKFALVADRQGID